MAYNNVTGSTATTLKAPGVYTITSTLSADKTWQLGDPSENAQVTVFVATNSTKVPVIQTNSSAQTFFGSTTDRLTLTTGQGCVRAEFIGLSTSVWAPVITSRSTAALGVFAGSTR